MAGEVVSVLAGASTSMASAVGAAAIRSAGVGRDDGLGDEVGGSEFGTRKCVGSVFGIFGRLGRCFRDKLEHLSAHTSTVGSNFFILEKKTNLNSARVLSSSNPIRKSGSDCTFIKKTQKTKPSGTSI